MNIIVIAHQKGGVGKSTIAFLLATTLTKSGLKVALMDTDLQGSLTSLNLMADGLNLIEFNEDFNNLKHMDYDIIIVDTPPYLSNNLIPLFNQSDFVLVPTKPGFFDMMAIKGTIELIKQSKIQNPNLNAGIVFNMVKHNSSIKKEVETLLNADIDVFKTDIKDRTIYTRSVLTGGVFNSTNKKAQDEIYSLCDELIKRINSKNG